MQNPSGGHFSPARQRLPIGGRSGESRRSLEDYTLVAASWTSYYFGYSEFRRLRRDVERALGARFDQRAYHDFVLAQGKLPMSAIREAVMLRFLRSTAVSSVRHLHDPKGDPREK